MYFKLIKITDSRFHMKVYIQIFKKCSISYFCTCAIYSICPNNYTHSPHSVMFLLFSTGVYIIHKLQGSFTDTSFDCISTSILNMENMGENNMNTMIPDAKITTKQSTIKPFEYLVRQNIHSVLYVNIFKTVVLIIFPQYSRQKICRFSSLYILPRYSKAQHTMRQTCT